ncbi:hypothetical protein [Pseudomonas syringae group genomosp. 3]|uniref:hypothetical protein n=1 Tax=Pseudomonas syringae group genomosp. 3 TaxID=251701 RepID=UPI0006E62321|nr:hypothetical protein [Pseudomonas syringae group genomosp. 3]KPX70342.1 hypothetical protein ALO84_200018 [Pseudomonas syringae pv. maculicola]
MSNLIFIGGQKGGTTKTTTAHLMSLGAILRGQPAAYVLTDPHRLLKPEGRPYGVMDGRDGAELAKIITASSNTKNGWLIIDGGGNRPELDRAISEQAQLTILPFRGSEEDLETISRDLASMPNAIALPSAWPTNKHAQEAAQKFIDALEQVYPGRVVKTPIYFVNSALELLGQRLDSPSTPVRNAARRAFSILSERLQLTLAQNKQ